MALFGKAALGKAESSPSCGPGGFGLSLFGEVSKEHEDVFMSPWSVCEALALVEAGTTPGGSIEAALADALGRKAPKTREEALLFSFPKTKSVELVSAMAVYVRGAVKPSYVSEVRNLFDAEAAPLTTAAAINDYVSEKTQGMITELIEERVVRDPRVQAVLVNALYFKGAWARRFDAEESEPGSVFRAPSGSVECTMMSSQEAHLSVGGIYGLCQSVALDYEGGELRAVFILPDKEKDDKLTELAAAVATRYEELRPRRRTELTVVQIPRLSLDFGTEDLMPSLRKLGLAALADEDGGLLRMADHVEGTEDLRLTAVLHKARIDLNEEGTVAAAATAAVMLEGCSGQPQAPTPIIRFDRPFIFVIENAETGMPLFVGKVVNNLGGCQPPPGPK